MANQHEEQTLELARVSTRRDFFCKAGTAAAGVGLIGMDMPGHATATSVCPPGTPAQFPVINVKNYGALGDGDHDDTQAIQDAINDAQGSCSARTVYFPRGNYKTSSALRISGTTISLQGEGPTSAGSVIEHKINSPAHNGLEIFNTDQDWESIAISISDLNFRGFYGCGIMAQGPESNATYKNSIGLRIHRVTCESNSQHGVFLGRGILSNLQNVISQRNSGDGFRLEGFHTSTTFVSCYSNFCPVGYRILNGSYCTFVSCAADNGTFGYLISQKSGTGQTVGIDGLAFVGCGAERMLGAAFLLESLINAGTRGVTLQSCFAVDCNSSGLWSSFLHARNPGAGIQALLESCCDTFTATPTGTWSVTAHGAGVQLTLISCRFVQPSLPHQGGKIKYPALSDAPPGW